MKAIQGIYKDGTVTLSEALADPDPGPINVLVIFPEVTDDPWYRIIHDPRPRPAFQKMAEEVLEELAQGKTEPLDLDRL